MSYRCWNFSTTDLLGVGTLIFPPLSLSQRDRQLETDVVAVASEADEAGKN
jgi:hypothetical protein